MAKPNQHTHEKHSKIKDEIVSALDRTEGRAEIALFQSASESNKPETKWTIVFHGDFD